jgi:hypothetical protein
MSNPSSKRSEADVPVDLEAASNADTSSGGQDRAATADEERIRSRAYELYLERGGSSSDQTEDWLRAEREYRGRGQADGESREEPPPAA